MLQQFCSIVHQQTILAILSTSLRKVAHRLLGVKSQREVIRIYWESHAAIETKGSDWEPQRVKGSQKVSNGVIGRLIVGAIQDSAILSSTIWDNYLRQS